MSRTRKAVVVATAIALAAGVAACSSTPSPTTAPSAPSSTSSAPAPQATTPPAESGAAPSATGVTIPPAPADPVAAAAWEALLSPQGEYAASASYQAVIAKFGSVEPYVSIRAAEERHIDALTRQLQRLGVAVPPNPYTGKIAAPSNLEAAATAWAAGEVNNVAMYDRLLAKVDGDAALTRVFGNLRRASNDMHLPAFRAAAANGGQLTPDQMTALGLH